MNLIIDQGNTRTKLALFKDGHMRRSTTLDLPDAESILDWCAPEEVEAAIISSVVSDELFENLKGGVGYDVINLSAHTRLPFTLNYNTPETLGLDRIALAAAAVTSYPAKDCLVIDAGTCITYDFVNRSGEFLGGAISPGIHMRFKALNHFTARLPMGSMEHSTDLIGKSTLGSIGSGVINGAINEVSGTIKQYEARFPEMITVLTGGDAIVFDGLVKNTIFAAPDFLLKGLNNILDYHAEVL